MSNDELQRRYRRLLRWYPRDHRLEHEEEMLGVLIQAARARQTRPSLRDAVDLALGGVRIRSRRAIATISADAGWRDAFAVTSVLVPLFMCAKTIRLVVDWVRWPGPDVPLGFHGRSVWPDPRYDWVGWAVWPAVVALAAVGARRLAAGAAFAATSAYAALLTAGYVFNDVDLATPVLVAWWPLLGLLAGVSLLISPRRRGLILLGRRHLPIAGAAAAVVGYAETRVDPSGWLPYQPLIVPVIVVVTALYAVRTPVGRRVVVLLLAPYAWFKMVEGVINATLSDHGLVAGTLVVLIATAIVASAAPVAAVYALERTRRLARPASAAERIG